MKTKQAVWLAFLLNLSFAIVEFIAGGIFGSSAVLADSVHAFQIVKKIATIPWATSVSAS